MVAEIEQHLELFNASKAAYHGGDFNGVSCRRIVGKAKEVSEGVREILIRKKNENCEDTTINKKLKELEQTLGLLDAAFAYLSILHPTDDEKLKAREAVEALSKHWRSIGLSVTLKAHVLECHICDFHEKWGVRDKEESFIEQGHQVDLKDNRRYCGVKKIIKKTESSLKARSNATHPLVLQQNSKVLQTSKWKAPEQIHNDGKLLKKCKMEKMKEEKETKQVKRENFVSNHNKK